MTRVALVSGGSRGIGRSICLGLAEDGCDVAVNYRRDAEAAEQTVKEIEALGRRAIAVAADSQARGVCVAFAGAVHGAPDVQKVHSYRIDAFSSGDAGPLAYVEEGRLRMLRRSQLQLL